MEKIFEYCSYNRSYILVIDKIEEIVFSSQSCWVYLTGRKESISLSVHEGEKLIKILKGDTK